MIDPAQEAIRILTEEGKPKRKFKIIVDTHDMMQEFGLLPDKAKSWDDSYMTFYDSLWYDVDKSQVWDFIEEHQITGCDLGDIYGAIEDAWKSEVASALEKERLERLEEWLGNVSGIEFDHEVPIEHGVDNEGYRETIHKTMKGKSSGIEQAYVLFDKTVLIINEDILQLLFGANIIDIDSMEFDLKHHEGNTGELIKGLLVGGLGEIISTYYIETPRDGTDNIFNDWYETTDLVKENLGSMCEKYNEAQGNWPEWWIDKGELEDCSKEARGQVFCKGLGWIDPEDVPEDRLPGYGSIFDEEEE